MMPFRASICFFTKVAPDLVVGIGLLYGVISNYFFFLEGELRDEYDRY